MKSIALVAAIIAAAASAYAGDCDFARQIQSDFTARFQWTEEIQRHVPNPDDIFRHDGQPRPLGVDGFSVNCLACHDGNTATGGEVRIYEHKGNNAVGSSHPIGTDYAQATFRRKGLMRIDRLDQGIILIDGKMGCLSCHDMLNPVLSHLTVQNDGSALCLMCHQR